MKKGVPCFPWNTQTLNMGRGSNGKLDRGELLFRKGGGESRSTGGEMVQENNKTTMGKGGLNR